MWEMCLGKRGRVEAGLVDRVAGGGKEVAGLGVDTGVEDGVVRLSFERLDYI